ncbi:MAG: tetratricopeptide repeat protein [Desulfobacteraceae bacterium]|nr:tetratricopeptide repeat protein [Desulfobacteraceae bacterium]
MNSNSGPNYTARQLQEMGEKYLTAGDTPNALKCLTDADRKRPGDPVLQYDLGLAYNQRGLSDKALFYLQNALKIKPVYPEALNAIGTVYAERGQNELAQEAFQKALDDPFYRTPGLAAYNLGRLYEKKGDPERALTLYQQAVKFEAGYGIAWYRIGQILETMRRGDEARHAYGKAVAASPDLAEAHVRYGIMSYQAGDMEAAIFSLTRVGKIAPNTPMADEARGYLEKLRGVTPGRLSGGPSDIEVITHHDLQRQQKAKVAPPTPTVKMQPVFPPQEPSSKAQLLPAPAVSSPPPPQAPPSTAAAPVTATAVPAPPVTPPAPPAPPAAPVAAPASSPPATTASVPAPESADPAVPTFKYIVQAGSFVDQEKAEEMKKNLLEKGYKVVVKPLKHQVLGKVYVLQLQAVSTMSKATTLMMQLGSEVPGEPVILKVPVPKPAEPLPSQAPAQ